MRVANATPGTGALANIYAVDNTSSPISGSVVTADSTGTFNFYAPDGRYDLTAAVAGFTKVVGDVEVSDITETNTGDTVPILSQLQLGATDTGISRTAAGVIVVGNGTQGDASGTLKAASVGEIKFAEDFANVQAAINALPAAGGTVYALASTVNLALGTIDAGTKAVTLYLGPFNFTADHIVLQPNFRMIGTSPIATVVTSIGVNGQPLIVNNTSGLLNIRFPEFSNILFVGASGNTSQKGMFLDISANTTLSVIDHMLISHVNFSGFKGVSLHFRGSLNTGTLGNFIQFFVLDHVTAVRPSSGAEALRCEGATGQFSYYSCQLDGAAKGDGTNIYIGGTSNSDATFPYSHTFYDLTSQGADNCFTGNGYNNIAFYNSHHENLNGAYLLQSTFTNSRNGGTIFSGGYFASVGSNAGNGYILKSTTSLVYGTRLEKNNFTTLHDKTVNSTTLAGITVKDNYYAQNLTAPIITVAVDASFAPAATMNIGSYHTVALSASATSMTTINSALGPGELVTFYANGTCQFATGGNITLPGVISPLVLATGENATFENSDYTGTNTWRLAAVNSVTVTGKTLTLAGSSNSVTLLNSQDPAGAITGNGADQTVFSFTIPANQIQAGKGLRVTMAGSSNNAVSCAWKLTLGATTLITVTTTTAATFSASYIIVNNAGVQNAQNLVGYAFEGASASGNGTGTVSSSENFANALVLKLTANEANPNTVTPKKWLIELIN